MGMQTMSKTNSLTGEAISNYFSNKGIPLSVEQNYYIQRAVEEATSSHDKTTDIQLPLFVN